MGRSLTPGSPAPQTDAQPPIDGALAEVIRRATAARVALAAGNRPESGAVGSILASTPGKVDVYAGRVEALTDALSIVGIPDEETYLQAYRPRRR